MEDMNYKKREKPKHFKQKYKIKDFRLSITNVSGFLFSRIYI